MSQVTSAANLSVAEAAARIGCELLNVDDLEAGGVAENLERAISSDTLAYIVYTSGSTGQPNGVVQNHRNVLHKIMTPTDDFHFCPEDRLSLLYGAGVGVGVRNTFCALLNGAALVPLDVKTLGPGDLAAGWPRGASPSTIQWRRSFDIYWLHCLEPSSFPRCASSS